MAHRAGFCEWAEPNSIVVVFPAVNASLNFVRIYIYLCIILYMAAPNCAHDGYLLDCGVCVCLGLLGLGWLRCR